MIILDSSTLRGVGLNSSSAELLGIIRAAGVERVGVPWVVSEELAAQQAVKYQAKHEKAVEALDALNACTPWKPATTLPDADVETVRAHSRRQLEQIAELIPTSERALAEATFREANVLPPCKVVKDIKTGGRDAAIWLTAVEFAKSNPDETVYFVSANTTDFGDGSRYREPMARDLAGVKDRFVHLTALDDVADRFAQPDEVSDADVTERLTTPPQRAAVRVIRDIKEQFPPRGPGEEFVPFKCSALGWDETPVQETAAGWIEIDASWFQSVSDVSGYRIGDHRWCVATVQWLFSGTVQLPGLQVPQTATAMSLWKTRLLFTMSDATDAPVTVLRHFPSEPVPDQLWSSRFKQLFPAPRLGELRGAGNVNLRLTDLEKAVASFAPGTRRFDPIPPFSPISPVVPREDLSD
ncbi:PIN domain-containing protein [Streptomyces mirabilis]|uniref:PIN domain-containing protein n=1 Tax=Streptomyces mirabilis TaxID=68239 RepID=UPI0035D67050